MSKAIYKSVPISQIDRPPAPLRVYINPEKLAQLGQALAAHGQLHPVVVKPNGDRYTIIAGDRRLQAATAIGWTHLDAKILHKDVKNERVISLVENIHHEPLTPLEEAREAHNLVYEENQDVDLVAGYFCKSRAWVDGRLELCTYPQDLIEAIHAEAISLTVARELARVNDDGYRGWLLHNAKENGATGKTARMWADEWSRSHTPDGETITAHPGPPPPYEGQPVGIGCAGCDTLYPIAQLRPLYVCPGCQQDHFTTKAAARKAAQEARP